jgi:hypothetical protein
VAQCFDFRPHASLDSEEPSPNLGEDVPPHSAGRDSEIHALETVIQALEPLSDDARGRVLEYTLRRLGMRELPAESPELPGLAPLVDIEPLTQQHLAAAVTDIRTLREQKNPASANEMAALAAYYLSELAPGAERTQTVTSGDIERLFKQANFRLPSRIGMALPNAAAAGYFDKAGSGGWRLNPVGHNLVTQTLPRAGAKPQSRATRSRKPAGATGRKTKTGGAKKTAAKSSRKR